MVSLLLFLSSSLLAASPEERGLEYLSREVPRWSAENKCFSCHNNGDAARALYVGLRLGMTVPAPALRDTSGWLAQPGRWGENEENQPFKDRRLARLQFAVTLQAAVKSRQIEAGGALKEAAELVAREQDANGSWQVEAPGTLGSPGTWGIPLATVLARELLHTVNAERYAPAVRRADAWLLELRVVSILDAAAVLLARSGEDSPKALQQRDRCLDILLKGEARDGGWGPYVTSPPEPFDTAVVLLALTQGKGQVASSDLSRRGRAYLIRTQAADGSWPATTRPAGADSYAQHIATTGWATLALLLSQPKSIAR